MKRGILITIGIILILLLIAVWVYILFFSDNQDVENSSFSDFGYGQVDNTTARQDQKEDIVVVDLDDESRLKQLTTEPIIGFSEVQTSPSSTPVIYYAKPGTGHITAIDLNSGEERRVSGTTIPSAVSAYFTSDGNYVLYQSGFGSVTRSEVSELNESTGELISREPLPNNLISVKTTPENTFLFGVIENGEVVGKHLDPKNNNLEDLFTIPFIEVVIEWGENKDSTHYVYPKPASNLEGYVYEINNAKIRRLPISGLGLTMISTELNLLYGLVDETSYQSWVFSEDGGEDKTVISVFPEKCTYIEFENWFVCARAGDDLGSLALDKWYQGRDTHNDNLWVLDADLSIANLLVDIEKESGRQVDVYNLTPSSLTRNVYFQNKTDQYLWMYDLNLN